MQKINCYDENGNTIQHLVQWDKNQVIYADNFVSGTTPSIHYAMPEHFEESRSYGNTVTNSNNKLSIKIPNELLTKHGRLYVYLYYSTTTKYVIELTVKSKPQPSEYVYEDNVDYISVSQLETRITNLTNRVTTLENKIKSIA